MTATPAGPGSGEEMSAEDELHAIAGRAIRVGLAIVQVMVAAVLLLAGVSSTTISYPLPPQPGTDVLPTATVRWGPGVAVAVLAGVVLAASIGWLVWNARARPRTAWWVLSAVVTVAAAVIVLGVDTVARPSF